MSPDVFTCARRLFFNLWQASRAAGDPEHLFFRIAKAYSGPGRFYHDLGHVVQVLSALSTIRTRVNYAQEWAVWFHGIDCSLFDHRCVERSAEIAFNEMRRTRSSVSPSTVAEYVRATDYRLDPADDPLRRELIDADWSIMGQAPEVYHGYQEALQNEARPVLTGPAYWKGRVNFLSRTLARPAIYWTASARAAWEHSARVNLERERTYYLQKLAAETL